MFAEDGCVNFEEFLQMMFSKMDGEQQPEQELKEVFCVLDTDQDGVISTADLHHVLTKLGENLTQVVIEKWLCRDGMVMSIWDGYI